MRKQRLFAAALSAVMTLGMLTTAFAGTWEVDFNGWWYVNEDGTCPADGWQWIDGDGDGYSECYYFDPQGYVVRSSVIDGYSVNSNGHWTVANQVQLAHTGSASGSTAAASQTSTAQSQGTAYADIYRQYAAQYGATEVKTEKSEYMEEPEKTVTGVSFLGLYDLDGNGTKELLIGYTTPNPEEYAFCRYKFGLDVYTQSEAGAVLCGKIEEAEFWTGGEADCGIRLMTKDGKTYIVAGSAGTGAGAIHHFYTLSYGALQETLTYELFEEIKINGQVVSDDTDLWDGWTIILHHDLYGFEAGWSEDFNVNASVDRINAAKKELGV